MASNINDTAVNSDYPIAGVDNDSQGFRDNFSTIKTNFVAAKAEIETLQTTTAKLNVANNFLGNTVSGANLENVTETAYVASTTVNTSQNINVDSGGYQEFKAGADITFTLSNWSSVTAKAGKIRVHVQSDQAAGSATNRTITFASNAGAGTIKTDNGWPTANTTAVIGAPGADEASKYYAFEFTSYDSGATVWAKYLGIFQ
jgi:hypothetical protein|tara:strand:- start:441 stop:1046 length:606 start_codon:yes stop_codon:yes gene_type:complete